MKITQERTERKKSIKMIEEEIPKKEHRVLKTNLKYKQSENESSNLL